LIGWFQWANHGANLLFLTMFVWKNVGKYFIFNIIVKVDGTDGKYGNSNEPMKQVFHV
jgi:hypothetical protein